MKDLSEIEPTPTQSVLIGIIASDVDILIRQKIGVGRGSGQSTTRALIAQAIIDMDTQDHAPHYRVEAIE